MSIRLRLRRGAPSDVTVSPDKKWLAVIYSAGGGAHVAVFGKLSGEWK